MVMSLSGERHFPSAAYAVLEARDVVRPGQHRRQRIHELRSGGDALGDYSWSRLDPSGTSVWMATEYMPPKASQTTDGLRDWGTRVINIPTG